MDTELSCMACWCADCPDAEAARNKKSTEFVVCVWIYENQIN